MSRSPSALVIGGTRGIGFAVARKLAARGQPVVLVGRDRETGERARATLRDEGGEAEFVAADLADVAAAAEALARVEALLSALDTVVHSADILTRSRRDGSSGVEASFATNYLSRFLFDTRLLSMLQASAPARILHVASPRMPRRALTLDEVPPPPGMDGYAAHGVGQRANDVLTVEMGRRLSGSGVAMATLGPGMVRTEIRRRGRQSVGMRVFEVLASPITREPERIADVAIDLLARPLDSYSGMLFDRNGRVVPPHEWATSPELGAGLWRRSEELVAVGPF